MTIYETIKAAISVKQAAEHYGLKVNRNGMACCPFHNDRHGIQDRHGHYQVHQPIRPQYAGLPKIHPTAEGKEHFRVL